MSLAPLFAGKAGGELVRRMALLLALAVILSSLSGCHEKSKLLCGTWKIEKTLGKPPKALNLFPIDSLTLTINQDQTIVINSPIGILTQHQWEVQGNRIIVKDQKKGHDYQIIFKVSKDRLHLRYYSCYGLILSRIDQPSAE